MRKFTIVLALILSGTFNGLWAQDAAVAKTAGYDLKKNVKCRVMPSGDGCSIVFENAVRSPRDVSTGLATGKRLHEPVILVKEYRVSATDNSVSEITSPRDMATGQATGRMQSEATTALESATVSGLGVGKVSMQDFHFVVNSQGNKREITCTNGECEFPSDLPNGRCTVTASWSWGMSQSGSTSSSGMSAGKASPKLCTATFFVDIKDGCYMAINEKGLPGEKKPVKTKAATTSK